MEIDEWHPPSQAKMPVGPQSFPRRGVNALATVGARGVARTIDAVLLGVPYMLIATLVVLALDGGGDPAEPMEQNARAYIAVLAPLLVIAVIYETACVALWGQTLGKWMMGIRVARQVNGRCPLWWEAALRIGLPAVVAAIPLPFAGIIAIGLYSTAGFDPMRRNIADRAAGTVVVRAR